MKFLNEYRSPELVKAYLEDIRTHLTRPWTIMEVCGGQTHSLVKNGLLEILPDEITMVHGPGCPVCVTPLHLIDQAVWLAEEEGVILCSFGDMLRVPGSGKSLLEAKAGGADVRVLYSPLEAVKLARQHPGREVVFFAVGFETTAPANALSVIQSRELGLDNYSILTSHVRVPPAMQAVLDDEETTIQGFLGAGHVCAIMGLEEYEPIVRNYQIPVVITGFEPADLLQGISMVVRQLEGGQHILENQYSRAVRYQGNPAARRLIQRVFEVNDREWRGIGTIPGSGYRLRPEYAAFDAEQKFHRPAGRASENPECIANHVLKGIKKPHQCPQFGKGCTPSNPLGAPMVSSEGACAAYYHFAQTAAELDA
jgi:hydrogenase expression/formation protein HypD